MDSWVGKTGWLLGCGWDEMAWHLGAVVFSCSWGLWHTTPAGSLPKAPWLPPLPGWRRQHSDTPDAYFTSTCDLPTLAIPFQHTAAAGGGDFLLFLQTLRLLTEGCEALSSFLSSTVNKHWLWATGHEQPAASQAIALGCRMCGVVFPSLHWHTH